ncbi:PREDICTED: uncharacterized protein LOC109295553 isoform X2 [Gavialis gangeticus]|uniref:uncharacterized protein LOC109295553 isoform X2 n=1 Tax=Gavialis gangeticus TaxID=94835 RepID=UPI00092E9683|nr:PREDICTED: uncharacterized protein LOC109295553 isoform X2 [Gavialis gangeticus]XP_019370016.1 PREDICTED: uncharacterized protein LOC109295553 isoform X2 [Gavialis gangeticus]XP_019370017.1 PREDICTED: uncharacterized protein LOC109295553 isoform X2 [Gavialis gangeticus]XP_019370018.1 PREDICTED: uncharacterized protein LOC109295553 isoform X2 [Gavialis gangeticus]XP_019370019.1 PREDICTED: uncharacterized protein LOC109295553 isoform X2 [Gavialis gangeticus]
MTSPLPFPSLLSDEEKPVVVLWGKEHPHVLSCVSLGCELNASTRKYIVKEEDDFLEHLVSLKTICLGAEAKDELNVVAVAAKNTYGDNTPMPIASLKLSVLPMATLDGFEFTPPVDFVLKSGTGPVYLHGQHVICGILLNLSSPQRQGPRPARLFLGSSEVALCCSEMIKRRCVSSPLPAASSFITSDLPHSLAGYLLPSYLAVLDPLAWQAFPFAWGSGTRCLQTPTQPARPAVPGAAAAGTTGVPVPSVGPAAVAALDWVPTGLET